MCPEWSPNGRQLAFRVGTALWVADSTSGNTTIFQLGARPWGENGFAWSRDGSRIAVAEPGQIRVVSINGSGQTLFPVNSGPTSLTGSMAWTADDDSILYIGADLQGDPLAVNRVDANGTNDTQLASGSDATLSPDGTQLAYIDGQSNDQHVVTMATWGGNRVDVAFPPGYLLEGLLWSPDGKRLLLSSVAGVVSVAVSPGSPWVVYPGGQGSSSGAGLDLENTWSDVAWQPVTGSAR